MNKQLKNFLAALVASVLLMHAPLLAAQLNNTYINHATRFAISPPLRELARLPQPLQYGFHEAELVHRFPTHLMAGLATVDTAEQRSAPAGAAYSLVADFVGLGVGFPGWYGTYYPPDSTMAVGDTQIVQWVNVAYAVCQKASPYTCGLPIQGNKLWTTLGGVCAKNNGGDIIPQWDLAAHRWLLTQNVFVSPYAICVAVSTSPDATGSYYLYQFPVVGSGDPDYPKWGIWPTGYFQSYNSLFGSACTECAVACAYNSAKMLVGDNTAEQICHAYAGGDNYLLPADRDSPTPPPDGEDEFYIGSVGAVDNSHLSLYSVHINNQSDWMQGATFTGDGNSQLIAIDPFNPACNNPPNLGGNCVPQKGVTDTLDSLGSVMYRFAYWNDSGDPANFTISASPASLSIEQGSQGTSTITSTISGDFNGPISLSASGVPCGAAAIFTPTTIPAPGSGTSTMTITVGASVPAGTYPITVTGSSGGSQESTTVTLTVTAPEQPNFTLSASPASLSVQQGNQGTSAITTTVSGDFNSSIALSASGVPSGTTVSFNPNPISAPGSGNSTMTITVGSSTPAGTYPITVTGNGGGIQQNATVTLTVTSSVGLLSVGFDFRGTATFVTDPPGDTYVLSTTAYPTTVNRITFGWVKTSLVGARNRSKNLDPRLAGINFAYNGSPATFYVNLPSAGTYNLSLAMGDQAYTGCWVQCQVQFLDGNTVLATVTGGQISASYFYDAQGNKWSAAAWPTSNVSRQVTLTGTRLTVVVGTNKATGGDITPIAFLGVTQLSGPLSPAYDADQGASPAQHWLVTFDVTASGGNIGPRWMEITAPSTAAPVTALGVFQQGTYAPDGNWRWMGSVARDKAGDILLGYSESCGDSCPGGTSMYPSIYIAGRQVNDPLGNLQGEVQVIAGGGAQPDTSNRWGDYSTMRIDQDGCTFWYTQEYYLVSQADHWSTQIASAKFQNCN